MDDAAVATADFNARHWEFPVAGKIRPGSPEHFKMLTALLGATYNPYKPAVLDWPKLDPETLARITSLPIWDIAVQTEGKARLRMLSYSCALPNGPWRDAIAQNGWEEGRHKHVLSNLVEAYGIKLEPEPAYIEPKDPEWAYLVTGFSECIDSFFAFGLFELARRSAFFPGELVDTFEPVMQEECRHILLFANWLAAHRCNLAWWKRPWFEIRVLAVWAFLGLERIGMARGMDDGGSGKAQDNNFTVTGSKSMTDDDISVPELMALCLEENDRRFVGYDQRLLRPTTMPALVRFALRFMRKRPAANAAMGASAAG